MPGILDKKNLRTIRGQLTLIAGLLLGGIVLAAAIATQRRLFESWVTEKYAPVPDHAKRTIETDGDLRTVDKSTLYDAWMTEERFATEALAAKLREIDAPYYLQRARRTLVAGNLEQRTRAVRFLGHLGHADAVPLLERAALKAERRKEMELAVEIRKTLEKIGRK